MRDRYIILSILFLVGFLGLIAYLNRQDEKKADQIAERLTQICQNLREITCATIADLDQTNNVASASAFTTYHFEIDACAPDVHRTSALTVDIAHDDRVTLRADLLAIAHAIDAPSYPTVCERLAP